MAIDDMLGRDFTVSDGYTVRGRVTVVGWDPEKGWRLAGADGSAAWWSFAEFERMLDEGFLQ